MKATAAPVTGASIMQALRQEVEMLDSLIAQLASNGVDKIRTGRAVIELREWLEAPARQRVSRALQWQLEQRRAEATRELGALEMAQTVLKRRAAQ